ncbi:MAG: cyclopropane-fatty-acyl-phospholipid synthase family protein [Novosphingobium sp.]|uniref:cyclopropane-fatty-acyl-phospholipid synthase family protein n=1 Tax=Novosphingobium sp. TaxID=1874826 RepID=UPI00301AC0BB
MNAHVPGRGGHLIAGGKPLASTGGRLTRLFAGPIGRILDRIDAGLAQGSLIAHFPGGLTRLLGGRGDGPAAQVTVHDWRAVVRLVTSGSVGCYQGYEAGEWDSPDPVLLFTLFVRNAATLGDTARAKGLWRLGARLLHSLRRNSRGRAARNISAHYDLGNDFYALWLDPTMSYSAACWDGLPAGASLEDAQRGKVDRMAERLALQPGDKVLEIGCGWGYMARRIAERHKVGVTAISLSEPQLAWARVQAAEQSLPGLEYRRQDYRDVEGVFDAVVSTEMVEAVGREWWPTYLACIARALKPGGRAALQYIAIRDDLFEAYARSADFIQTYIFPGGMLLSVSEFRRLAAERGLEWADQTDFAADYARTLRLWREAFDRAVEGGQLPAGFDARFVRLWRFYLMYCEAGFAGGGITVSQVTLLKQT